MLRANRVPLAERMRPRHLAEVVGQSHLLGRDGWLARAVQRGDLPSLILWGPPGCGKTTLASLLAEAVGAELVVLSAVLSGTKELRAAVEAGRNALRPMVLFVDEIHRWNKAQQDALLPHVESGTVRLLGATTENPSFQIIAPLRSRAEVVRLHRLEQADLMEVLSRALLDERGLGRLRITADQEVLERLASLGDGDARRCLGLLERLALEVPDGGHLGAELVRQALGRRDIGYDRAGEEHYNLASALIKSIRGSDPDAGVYWLARMLAGGEDPMFIARRLVIFASEDVGNADPRALQVAVAGADAVHLVGLPEARIILSQVVTFLATTPKSNAAYVAVNEAAELVEASGALPVPLHLRNAVTPELRRDGYLYPHDHPDGVVAQRYLPDGVMGGFYRPKAVGHEKTILERLTWWSARRRPPQ